MNERELFSYSIYEEQTHLAESELDAFIGAVTKLFGAGLACFAAEDWLEEADLMDAPPRSASRDWRSVTIAASARLSSRIDAPQHRHSSLSASADARPSPILSSNSLRH